MQLESPLDALTERQTQIRRRLFVVSSKEGVFLLGLHFCFLWSDLGRWLASIHLAKIRRVATVAILVFRLTANSRGKSTVEG